MSKTTYSEEFVNEFLTIANIFKMLLSAETITNDTMIIVKVAYNFNAREFSFLAYRPLMNDTRNWVIGHGTQLRYIDNTEPEHLKIMWCQGSYDWTKSEALDEFKTLGVPMWSAIPDNE